MTRLRKLLPLTLLLAAAAGCKANSDPAQTTGGDGSKGPLGANSPLPAGQTGTGTTPASGSEDAPAPSARAKTKTAASSGDDDDDDGYVPGAGGTKVVPKKKKAAGTATTGEGATGDTTSDTGSTTGGTGDDAGTTGATGTGGGTSGAGTVFTTPGTFDTTSVAHWFKPTFFVNQAVNTKAKDAESATIIDNLQQRGWGTGRFQIDFSIDVFYTSSPTKFLPTHDNGVYHPDSDVPLTIPVAASDEPIGFEGNETRAYSDDQGDHHYLAFDVTKKLLYELWLSNVEGNTFELLEGSGSVVWDVTKDHPANLRGDYCTSADAGGFPIAAMLLTAEEVKAGEVNHAIRFILPNNHIQCQTFVHPASHSTGPRNCAGWATDGGVPYGAWLRLRADYPVDSLPTAGAKVVAKGLQKFGMILSDGGNIALTAKSDKYSTVKWSDAKLGPLDLQTLQPSDFEMVDGGTRFVTGDNDCTRSVF